jgi:quercetin dioxygenase-like cupin family protein
MSEPTAKNTVFIDNDRVRVSEWRFAPGTETGHHRHEYDYVVVPMTDGDLTIRDSGGESTAQLVTGQPYAREVGVEHNVINGDDHEIVFIEIEMK